MDAIATPRAAAARFDGCAMAMPRHRASHCNTRRARAVRHEGRRGALWTACRSAASRDRSECDERSPRRARADARPTARRTRASRRRSLRARHPQRPRSRRRHEAVELPRGPARSRAPQGSPTNVAAAVSYSRSHAASRRRPRAPVRRPHARIAAIERARSARSSIAPRPSCGRERTRRADLPLG